MRSGAELLFCPDVGGKFCPTLGTRRGNISGQAGWSDAQVAAGQEKSASSSHKLCPCSAG